MNYTFKVEVLTPPIVIPSIRAIYGFLQAPKKTK